MNKSHGEPESTNVAPEALTLDLRDSQIRLFTSAWRIARERLRQQDKTLSVIFAAAAEADADRPLPPQLDPEDATGAVWEALIEFFEKSGTATDTRDAYAIPLVIVIDDILKMTREFYDRIPGVPASFDVRVRGKDLFSIFRAAGNNIRHYREWRVPTNQNPKAEQAYRSVVTIATVVGREVPPYDELSVMATNWAWPILQAVGDGTFDGLLLRIRECMDELIRNVGMANDPLIQAEIGRERQIAH